MGVLSKPIMDVTLQFRIVHHIGQETSDNIDPYRGPPNVYLLRGTARDGTNFVINVVTFPTRQILSLYILLPLVPDCHRNVTWTTLIVVCRWIQWIVVVVVVGIGWRWRWGGGLCNVPYHNRPVVSMLKVPLTDRL